MDIDIIGKRFFLLQATVIDIAIEDRIKEDLDGPNNYIDENDD